MTSRTIGSSSTTRIVVMRLFSPPFRVMAVRPLRIDGAESDSAQGMTGRGVDDRQVEMPDQQGQRDVHEAVVKEDGERRRERDVQLLSGVEAPLWRRPPAEEPAEVVAIETVHLARELLQPP